MQLFLSIEAQHANEIGLFDIFKNVNSQLHFVTDKNAGLEEKDNYGTEFRIVSVIPTCVDEQFWKALGWKERHQIWRKKKEADIRLRMDYDRFISETPENKKLMYVDIIIRSIKFLVERSKGDFRGEALIKDILEAVQVTQLQLNELNNECTNTQ